MLATYVETFGFGGAMDRIKGHAKHMSQGNLDLAAWEGAEYARELIEETMQAGKRGTKWPQLPNVSSSPAETPAEQSGALVNSLTVKPWPNGAALESAHKHAIWMEFGFTTSDGGFHIRPWMRTTIDKNRKEIQARMREAMKGVS